MSKSKKILTVVLIAFLLGSAFGSIHVFAHSYSVVLPKVMSCIAIAAIVAAIFYAISGYSKSAAPAYKIFMLLAAAYYIGLAIDTAVNVDIYMYTINKGVIGFQVGTNCMIFGLMLLLGFSKDIGKLYTNIIGIVSMLLTIPTLVAMFIGSGQVDELMSGMFYSRIVNRIVLIATAYVLIQFKYLDKDERGTK